MAGTVNRGAELVLLSVSRQEVLFNKFMGLWDETRDPRLNRDGHQVIFA